MFQDVLRTSLTMIEYYLSNGDLHRIIEIEWAAKNGTSFRPSPKRPRKNKSRKKSRSTKSDQSVAQSDNDVEHAGQTDVIGIKGKEKENFGVELTNAGSIVSIGSPPKRMAAEMLEEGPVGTPRKHKKGKVSVDEDEDDDEDWEQWEPPAPMKAKQRSEIS